MHKKTVLLIVMIFLAAAVPTAAQTSDTELTRNIQKQLSGLDYVIERVAKIRGVQAIDNKVTVLPANQDDNRLRSAIANAIYSLTDFERYSMANPPIHVIVNRGHVTLVGVVRSEIEKRKAYEAARFINGVLALEDKVVVARR